MSTHAEHPLFFDDRRGVNAVGARVGLGLAVLVLNAGASDLRLSLVLGVLGLALLGRSGAAHGAVRSRVRLALVWALAGAAMAAAVTSLQPSSRGAIFAVGARMVCGGIWLAWLGTQVDWPALRRLLEALRVPAEIVASLDGALRHGLLTVREWASRRDAARLRLGKARLPAATWPALVAEGAMASVERLESMERHASLRAAAVGDDAGSGEGRLATSLEGVTAWRANRAVLIDVNLALAPGDWAALCGPSGAGKSTLLGVLAGIVPLSAGRMERMGRGIDARSALSRRLDGRVALLGQHPEHHFVASTVGEDIAWGLRHRGYTPEAIATRTQATCEALGIAHLLGRPCHALSFGEQKRAALAGLLVLEPSLLLLDEPTAGLDPVAAWELTALVRRVVGQTNASCVWATHDLANIPEDITRVVLLDAGTVRFDGPRAEGLSPAWRTRVGLAVAHRQAVPRTDPERC